MNKFVLMILSVMSVLIVYGQTPPSSIRDLGREINGSSDTEGNTIKFDIKQGKSVSVEYVDLGLESGTLWATCNVGAVKPENIGSMYAWGETEPKSEFTEDNYIWGYLSEDGLKSKGLIEYDDKKHCYRLTNTFDVATLNFGPDWCTPTLDNFRELMDLDHSWVVRNGVSGVLFKGNNGNTLFFPAVIKRQNVKGGYNNKPHRDKCVGEYWIVSYDHYYDKKRKVFYFDSSKCELSEYYAYNGLFIRPVRKK